MIPENYQTSREAFLQAAQQSGCSIDSIIHPLQGLNEEELALDVAITGSTKPQQTVIISSGLHGVEGFAGAAIQLALLPKIKTLSIKSTIRIVFLHALNPYGYSHLRRFDHHNIDCNRNFMSDDETYAGSPKGYSALNGLLNPMKPVTQLDAFYLRAVYQVISEGMSKMKNTIAAGQYDFPQGVFFGGQVPSWTFETFQSHWEHWTGSAPTVIHMDIHTGLGTSGQLQLMVSDPLQQSESEALHHLFPGQNLLIAASPSEHPEYQTHGDIGQWCRRNYSNGQYHYVCAEFGTHPPISVLRAICRENQLHHWGAKTPPVRSRVKQQIKESFCPKSPKWQNRIIQQGVSLAQHAILSITD